MCYHQVLFLCWYMKLKKIRPSLDAELFNRLNQVSRKAFNINI